MSPLGTLYSSHGLVVFLTSGLKALRELRAFAGHADLPAELQAVQASCRLSVACHCPTWKPARTSCAAASGRSCTASAHCCEFCCNPRPCSGAELPSTTSLHRQQLSMSAVRGCTDAVIAKKLIQSKCIHSQGIGCQLLARLTMLQSFSIGRGVCLQSALHLVGYSSSQTEQAQPSGVAEAAAALAAALAPLAEAAPVQAPA